jgi:hypothetical protein
MSEFGILISYSANCLGWLEGFEMHPLTIESNIRRRRAQENRDHLVLARGRISTLTVCLFPLTRFRTKANITDRAMAHTTVTFHAVT